MCNIYVQKDCEIQISNKRLYWQILIFHDIAPKFYILTKIQILKV